MLGSADRALAGLSVESFGSGAFGTATDASDSEPSVFFSGVLSAISGDFAVIPFTLSVDISAAAAVPVIGSSDNSTEAAGLAAPTSSGAAASEALGSGGLALLVELRFLDLWLIALPPSNCTSKAGACATSTDPLRPPSQLTERRSKRAMSPQHPNWNS